MTDERQFLAQVDDFWARHEGGIVKDIETLVSIRSVKEAEQPGAPFGAGPRAALNAALDMLRGHGLQAHDVDGYAGWGEVGGERGGHIATISHLDTVPEGEGWHSDPLKLFRRDGWLIARGVSDNKGPSVLSMYLARFFKETCPKMRYGLRVILGCNEESGMSDVDYYLGRHPMPVFCFTPDAGFPLCHGEKGLYDGIFTSKPLSGNIVQLNCGVAFNVIPERAACVVRATAAALPAAEHIRTEDAGGGTARIEAQGIGGHASHPEGTRNALGVLVSYLLDNNLCDEDERQFLALSRLICCHPDGSGVGAACEDDKFGPLTINGGILRLENGVLSQYIDIRYPTAVSGAQLTARFAALAKEHGAAYENVKCDDPFYMDPQSPGIKALLSAYNDVKGCDGKPFTMGGGTYARHFKNSAGFGVMEHEIVYPDFSGPAHGPDEGISVEFLRVAFRIYALAILRLQQIEF